MGSLRDWCIWRARCLCCSPTTAPSSSAASPHPQTIENIINIRFSAPSNYQKCHQHQVLRALKQSTVSSTSASLHPQTINNVFNISFLQTQKYINVFNISFSVPSNKQQCLQHQLLRTLKQTTMSSTTASPYSLTNIIVFNNSFSVLSNNQQCLQQQLLRTL